MYEEDILLQKSISDMLGNSPGQMLDTKPLLPRRMTYLRKAVNSVNDLVFTGRATPHSMARGRLAAFARLVIVG